MISIQIKIMLMMDQDYSDYVGNNIVLGNYEHDDHSIEIMMTTTMWIHYLAPRRRSKSEKKKGSAGLNGKGMCEGKRMIRD